MKVCVLASFMYDLVAAVRVRPEPGQTVVGSDFQMLVGGKGFNQAVAARRAGAEVAVVGRIGDDTFGAEFREFLEAEGIEAEHLAVDPTAGTGVGLPLVETGGENSIVVVPRANLEVSPHDVSAAASTIASADVLLVQLEIPIDAVQAAVQIAHDAGVAVVLNPAPYVELPTDLLAMVDVLVPNEGELRELAASPPEAEIDQIARDYWQGCQGALVVTLGGKGVLLLDGDAPCVRMPAPLVKAVDTIGAGDTFCGNLGARLARSESLREAVTAANVAAALSVMQRGGAPAAPSAEETAAALTYGPTSTASTTDT